MKNVQITNYKYCRRKKMRFLSVRRLMSAKIKKIFRYLKLFSDKVKFL